MIDVSLLNQKHRKQMSGYSKIMVQKLEKLKF